MTTTENENQVKIWYDDNAYYILNRLNSVLSKHGLIFEEDGEEHDGFILLNLVKLEGK